NPRGPALRPTASGGCRPPVPLAALQFPRLRRALLTPDTLARWTSDPRETAYMAELRHRLDTGLLAEAAAPAGSALSGDQLRRVLTTGLAGRFSGRRVLTLIPDFTRTVPLAELFPIVVDLLSDSAKLDFMVAL